MARRKTALGYRGECSDRPVGIEPQRGDYRGRCHAVGKRVGHLRTHLEVRAANDDDVGPTRLQELCQRSCRGRARPQDRSEVPGMLREQRSEEHTSGLQSLMRISYAVFCLKRKTKTKN